MLNKLCNLINKFIHRHDIDPEYQAECCGLLAERLMKLIRGEKK